MIDNVVPATIDNTTLSPMALLSKEENRKPNCNNPHNNRESRFADCSSRTNSLA